MVSDPVQQEQRLSEPLLSYATDTVRGPRGESTLNETVMAMLVLSGRSGMDEPCLWATWMSRQ